MSFFGSSYLPGVRASKKYKRKASYHRYNELAVYKKWIYIRDHELRAQVRTIWECNSVSQENPLDTRLQNQLSFTPVCLLVARLPWDRANHYTSHLCYRHGQHLCIRWRFETHSSLGVNKAQGGHQYYQWVSNVILTRLNASDTHISLQ